MYAYLLNKNKFTLIFAMSNELVFNNEFVGMCTHIIIAGV